MLKTNETSLKLFSKIAAALAITVLASACTHEQLKEEADVAAIEDTGSVPTPDLASSEVVADPLAESTPIPGDVGPTRVVRHAKKSVAKRAHHAKHHRVAHKKHKKVKTMVATRGTVDAQLPPPPPSSGPTLAPEDAAVPAPAVIDAASTLSEPADLGVESNGGHGLMISLAILGLGALAFAGVRIRRSRGSRRLVFN